MSEGLVRRIYSNPLFRHSFWSVFGNGLGNMLLLLAGIFIARMLGKDVYGEYGLVKTTMFHVASFATFGLVYTSTKFISQYVEEDKTKIFSIVRACLSITIISSSFLCILLFLFASKLAYFINEPRLVNAFRYLGVIIVIRALATTLAGILGGFKKYKQIGINNIVSGLSLLCLSVPLTLYCGVIGSLVSLLISQLINCTLNLISLNKVLSVYREINNKTAKVYTIVISFSIPVAIQELSWSVSNWGATLIITKYASVGEVGLYSAAAQWGAIATYIPALLSNVVLSYLSGVSEESSHKKLLNRMLLVYLVSSTIPVLVILLLSKYIVSMYGGSFFEMRGVLNILVVSTIFTCVAQVYQSDLLSRGKNWLLLLLRLCRDLSGLISIFIVLHIYGGRNAAFLYAVITLGISVAYFVFISLASNIDNRRKKINDEK